MVKRNAEKTIWALICYFGGAMSKILPIQLLASDHEFLYHHLVYSTVCTHEISIVFPLY